jgi:hypothetical protein
VRLGGLRWLGRVLPTVGSATSDLLSTTVIPLRSCVLIVVRSSIAICMASSQAGCWRGPMLRVMSFLIQHRTATQPTLSNDTSSRRGNRQVKNMYHLQQTLADTTAKHTHRSFNFSRALLASGVEHQRQQHLCARSDRQTPAIHNTTSQPTPTPARRLPKGSA